MQTLLLWMSHRVPKQTGLAARVIDPRMPPSNAPWRRGSPRGVIEPAYSCRNPIASLRRPLELFFPELRSSSRPPPPSARRGELIRTRSGEAGYSPPGPPTRPGPARTPDRVGPKSPPTPLIDAGRLAQQSPWAPRASSARFDQRVRLDMRPARGPHAAERRRRVSAHRPGPDPEPDRNRGLTTRSLRIPLASRHPHH